MSLLQPLDQIDLLVQKEPLDLLVQKRTFIPNSSSSPKRAFRPNRPVVQKEPLYQIDL